MLLLPWRVRSAPLECQQLLMQRVTRLRCDRQCRVMGTTVVSVSVERADGRPPRLLITGILVICNLLCWPMSVALLVDRVRLRQVDTI
eukprot:COSAG01_NODE_1694_length_9467_cov_4.976196_11_plen_88_part_00